MNWYIGQEIVAIENHPDGIFKMGDEFKVKDIRMATCKCYGAFDLYIGYTGNWDGIYCPDCGKREDTKILWLADNLFAPLEHLMSEEIKELLTDLPQHLQNIENEKIYLQTKKNYLGNGIYEDNETNDH